MGKKKKSIAKKSVSNSSSSKKVRITKSLWLTKSGKPKKNLKISKYLNRDGTFKKSKKLPKGVKTVGQLWKKLYEPKPTKIKEYQYKNGRWNRSIRKYLTKDGKLNKKFKFPPDIKTAQDLWNLLQANKLKDFSDKRVNCVENEEAYWIVRERLDKSFFNYKKVYMGGKQVSWAQWFTYGYGYTNEKKDMSQSPPTLVYTICKFRKYKYFFI